MHASDKSSDHEDDAGHQTVVRYEIRVLLIPRCELQVTRLLAYAALFVH